MPLICYINSKIWHVLLGTFEAGKGERAEILLRPMPISTAIRSLGRGVWQVPPVGRHTAWLSGNRLRADLQVTNRLFTWPRFQAGFGHFPGIPPFYSICKREA